MSKKYIELNYQEFFESDLIDGIYRLKIYTSFFEIVISGFTGKKNIDHFLVGLTGAMGRENTSPPYFSGAGIAKELSKPFISISDPTFDKGQDCTIGWYAGNIDIINLPNIIGQTIEKLALKYSATPIIFGGSGGGFAGLVLSVILKVKARILVWNPQTDISAYFEKSVITYLSTAFPCEFMSVKEKILLLDSEDRKKALITFLYRYVKYPSVNHSKVSPFVDVVYLQNISDSHVKSHTKPYFTQKNFERLSGIRFMAESVLMCFGCWGDGHIPPPRDILKNILLRLSENIELEEVVIDGELTNEEKIYLPVHSISNIDINALVSFKFFWENHNKYVELELKHDYDWYGAEFAIYYYNDDERVSIEWYTTSKIIAAPSCSFNKMHIFIKDIFGNTLYGVFGI